MRILSDDDLRDLFPVADVIGVMNTVFRARANGALTSPPRSGFDSGDVRLVWTPGGLPAAAVLGLRVYLTGLATSDQLVAAWEIQSGRLSALAIGSHLGRLRTDAIGGVAMDCLARADAQTVGVIGFGQQAWYQVKAAMAVRPIQRVLAYRRDRRQLEVSVTRAQHMWPIEVILAPSPQDAVAEADIVVTATGSAIPVMDPLWIRTGMHINALGPKYHHRTELPASITDAVHILTTDFPEQYRSDPDFLWYGTPDMDRMTDLAEFIAGTRERDPSAISLFLSHGLSGTEVVLLHEAAQRAQKFGRGQEVTL
jgi:ornithine cyclodeaminase